MNRIAVVTTSFPDREYSPGQEAAGAFVFDFVQELRRHVAVSVVAPSTGASLQQHEQFKAYYYEVPFLPLSLLKLYNPLHWSHIITTLRMGQTALWKAVSDDPVDYIFALWALPSGYWARNIWKQTSVPYGVWALGSDIWELGKIPLLGTLLRQVLIDSQQRFADGFRLKADVETIGQLPCRFLPSSRSLDASATRPRNTVPPYRLAFLGRWHLNKGIDLLLASLEMLTAEDWEKIAEVRVFGGGPLENQVRSHCAHLQERGFPIVCGGYLDKAEAARLLDWSDFVLIPSRIESVPVIFSDAMQMRRPVIAQPVGDLPRLVKHYDVGTLASSVTAEGFTEAIHTALAQPSSAYDAGTKFAAEEFSVRHSADSLLDILRAKSDQESKDDR